MSSPRRLVVGSDQEGVRLDRALASSQDDWTRSYVRRLVDEGHVTVNGRPAKPSLLLRAGDEVQVSEPPPRPLDVEAEPIPLAIVHEDDDILVLDKPADLVIHPAAGNPSGTLVNALLHHCRELSGIGGAERPGIVHRLDKDTTGVMVVAKTNRAHLALSRDFAQRRVGKTDLAVCYGVPAEREGVVDAPLGRHPRERQRMAVRPDGRQARTLYRVEEALDGTSLVSCRPVTGRTHQIRVHLAHLGHALVGDPLYAGRQWRMLSSAAARAACRDFPRQALHAWRLELSHPVDGVPRLFEAPLPEDLRRLLDSLRG